VRQALGLHQSHLASRSGYSQATISRIEQNQLRDPVVLIDLADALLIPRGIFGCLPALGGYLTACSAQANR
jgi:transcriptional regulator with XRE-family HTH domain